MTQLRINDEPVEAGSGENILQVARSRGLHIWFVCDGRGLCQTCECRVLEGGENLSVPTDLESRVLSDERRSAGFRLACQTHIAGPGPVSLVSRAEELRRSVRDAVIPGGTTSMLSGMRRFLDGSTRMALDLLGTVPFIASAVPRRLAEDPPTPSRIANYLRDSARLAGRLITRI